MVDFNPLDGFGLFGGGAKPTPLKLASGSPIGGVPGGTNGDPAQQQQAVVNAAMNNPDLSGILGTIMSVGGDVAGFLGQFLPKNADDSINWGGIGSDIGSFLSQHKGDILAAASVYEAAQRQGQADKYNQMALDQAKNTYDSKAPLRLAGQAGMLNPSAGTPDLSKISALGAQANQTPIPMARGNPNASALSTLATSGSGNPFAKGLPMASSPVAPPVTPPQAPGAPAGPQAPTFPPRTQVPFTPAGPPPDVAHPMTPPNKPTMPYTPQPLALAGSAPPPTTAPPGVTPPGVALPPGMKPPQGWTLPLAGMQ